MSTRMLCLTTAALVYVVCAAGLPGVTQEQNAEILRAQQTRRYAEAYLELAEVQLEMLLNANRKLARTYSKREINRARVNVAVAKEQLRLVTEPEGDAIQLHLKYAQEMAGVAAADYQRALKAKAALDGAYSDLQIQELQLKSEVAQLRLAIWSNPGTNVLSLLDHMHWQIERVSEEVLDLQKRVKKLER